MRRGALTSADSARLRDTLHRAAELTPAPRPPATPSLYDVVFDEVMDALRDRYELTAQAKAMAIARKVVARLGPKGVHNG